MTAGRNAAGAAGAAWFRGPGAPTIVGGEGTAMQQARESIFAPPFGVNGILYLSTPDNAWAVMLATARTWHYFWKTKGGTHIAIAPRHVGQLLYMETPDDTVCLDAKTGKSLARRNRRFNEQYFSTMRHRSRQSHPGGPGDDWMPQFPAIARSETALQ